MFLLISVVMYVTVMLCMMCFVYLTTTSRRRDRVFCPQTLDHKLLLPAVLTWRFVFSVNSPQAMVKALTRGNKMPFFNLQFDDI